MPSVRRLISQMGIVLVSSAFETFVTDAISEHSRYSGFCGKPTATRAQSIEDEESGDPLRSLYGSLRWDIQPIEYLLPLYDFFTLSRNCVVHRSGRANGALLHHRHSAILRKCLDNWPSRPGKKIPQLPPVEKGQDITFLPRHAILFSEVCQRAAIEIDSQLVRFLGVEGTVYMAAYHSLLADNRVLLGARRSPEQVVNLMLTERCHVRVTDNYEVIAALKKLGVWSRCRSRYGSLYAKK
jgi:hypothetical protein